MHHRGKTALVLALTLLLFAFAASAFFLVARERPAKSPIVIETSTTAPPGASAAGSEQFLRRPIELANLSSTASVTSASFTALAGETRLVSADISVDQPAATTNRQTGVLLQLTCADSAENRRVTQSITNVERGGRANQEARLLFTASRTGEVLCAVTARLYAEEADSGATAQVIVRPGSHLTVSPKLATWSKEWTWDFPQRQSFRSSLVREGETWTEAPERVAAVPSDQRFVWVQADHKVTVCFWRGGSSDVTTPLVPSSGGPDKREDLCQANPLAPGAIVRSRVELTRLTKDGRACAAPVTAIDQTFWVGGRQHHARVNADAVVLLPTGRDCTKQVRLRSWVENVAPDAGPALDFVVHAPDERLALLPASASPAH